MRFHGCGLFAQTPYWQGPALPPTPGSMTSAAIPVVMKRKTSEISFQKRNPTELRGHVHVGSVTRCACVFISWCCIPVSVDVGSASSGFHISDGVSIFDDVKEWSGPFFDAHQLGVRLNFDVDVKNSAVFDVDGTNVKTASWLSGYYNPQVKH